MRVGYVLVFRNVHFRNRVVQSGSGKGIKMLIIGANNASTFHIAITENQTIMNHESFRKRTESLVQHFTQRVFRGVIYISVGRQYELILMEYLKYLNA